jgi:RNA polymerase sigma factor (sigma-70 family)
LKLQGDPRLIAMARSGNAGAFETIVDRYQGRLLGFCRQMLGSTEDAEDVLQEVFVNAYRAMLADEREINLRPWLYRIARNRCLNHLRKPTADAQESMDMVPAVEAASTAEKVHNREEFRQLIDDVGKLPETQRTALLLREMDAMSYEEIAAAMETSVPSVKSLLVRARIALAEASQARQLTCGEVRLELAEAAEGLRKVSGPVRRHVRECEGCADFRSQVRSDEKALAALAPVGPLLAFKGFILAKLGIGGAGGSGGAGSAAGAGAAAGTGATTAGAGAASGLSAALGGGSAAGGIGAVGGAIGTKAVAGVVTAAVITAGAVEVNQRAETTPAPKASAPARVSRQAPPLALDARQAVVTHPKPQSAPAPAPAPEPSAPAEPAQVAPSPSEEIAGQSNTTGDDAVAAPPEATPKLTAAKPPAGAAGAPAGSDTVVVTVGGSKPSGTAPAESSTSPSESAPPPAETTPPPSEPAPPAEGTSSSSAVTSSEATPASG